VVVTPVTRSHPGIYPLVPTFPEEPLLPPEDDEPEDEPEDEELDGELPADPDDREELVLAELPLAIVHDGLGKGIHPPLMRSHTSSDGHVQLP
jgi:hypothetical protein